MMTEFEIWQDECAAIPSEEVAAWHEEIDDVEYAEWRKKYGDDDG